MKDLLNEKLKAYRALGPVLPEARKWLEESNLWMLLYTVLCQRGVRIEKKTLVDILAGRIMEDVHIDLYGFCFRLRDVYKDMISAVEMQATLNTKMLDGWYEDLLEPDGPVHRKDNAVVYDVGFIPCHCVRNGRRAESRGTADGHHQHLRLRGGFRDDGSSGGGVRAAGSRHSPRGVSRE